MNHDELRKIANAADTRTYQKMMRTRADAEFIAAANPKAIIALLDEIEALRKGQGHYEGKQS